LHGILLRTPPKDAVSLPLSSLLGLRQTKSKCGQFDTRQILVYVDNKLSWLTDGRLFPSLYEAFCDISHRLVGITFLSVFLQCLPRDASSYNLPSCRVIKKSHVFHTNRICLAGNQPEQQSAVLPTQPLACYTVRTDFFTRHISL
jgi:hypothetical protein